MKADVSALMDGELGAADQERTLRDLARDGELRRCWETYHLIGDNMRCAYSLSEGFTERVMGEIAAEPTVLAPARERRRPVPIALPLAASVAGVALVAWLALKGGAPVGLAPQTVATGPAPADRAPAQSIATVASVTSREQPNVTAAEQAVAPGHHVAYMLAHQAYSPRRSMQGMAQTVRFVSESGAGK